MEDEPDTVTRFRQEFGKGVFIHRQHGLGKTGLLQLERSGLAMEGPAGFELVGEPLPTGPFSGQIMRIGIDTRGMRVRPYVTVFNGRQCFCAGSAPPHASVEVCTHSAKYVEDCSVRPTDAEREVVRNFRTHSTGIRASKAFLEQVVTMLNNSNDNDQLNARRGS